MHVFYTLAICAAPSLGGCTVDTWLRAETDAAATDAALAACIAYERENAQTVLIPQTFRARDGSAATYFFPERLPVAGRDRAACMRAQGFVRAAQPKREVPP